jgi:recombinational DNA repair protein RecR
MSDKFKTINLTKELEETLEAGHQCIHFSDFGDFDNCQICTSILRYWNQLFKEHIELVNLRKKLKKQEIDEVFDKLMQ